MARLGERDENSVRELAGALSVLRDGEPSSLTWLVPELREILGADRVLAYGVDGADQSFALEFAHGAGFSLERAELRRRLELGLSSARRPWALFDPRRPEAQQRNVVVTMPPPPALAGRADTLFRHLGLPSDRRERLIRRMVRLNERFLPQIRLRDLHVCRVLVCEGPQLLAWLGAFSAEAFGERQRLVVARLVPALLRRLWLERTLDTAAVKSRALDAVLDAIGAPAWLLGPAGRISLRNASARTAAAPEHSMMLDAMHRGHCAGLECIRVVAPGMPDHHLVIDRRPSGPSTVRLEVVRRRWRLTERQTEILALVARGEANKSIAALLRCSVRAVEFHVTMLLRKAGVESRSGLVAAYFGV